MRQAITAFSWHAGCSCRAAGAAWRRNHNRPPGPGASVGGGGGEMKEPGEKAPQRVRRDPEEEGSAARPQR